MRSRYIVLFLFFLSFGVLSAQSSDWRELSLLYSRQALEAMKSGNWVEATDLAHNSLGFDNTNSDAFWVLGSGSLVASDLQGAKDHFENALKQGNFDKVHPSQVKEELGSILLRLKDYVGTLDILSTLSSLPYSARAQTLLARGYYFLGQKNNFEKLLRQALALATDPSPFLPFLLWKPEAFPELGSLLKREKALGQNLVEDDFVQALLINRSNKPSLVLVLKLLESSGYKHPLISELSFILGLIDEAALIKVHQDMGHSGQYTVLKELRTNDGEVFPLLRSGMHTLMVDWNADGFVDGSVIVSEGYLIKWTIDTNQDGTEDTIFNFESGLLSEVVEIRSNMKISISYEDYPWVKQCEVQEGSKVDRLIFAPYQTSIPVFSQPGPSDSWLIPQFQMNKWAVFSIPELMTKVIRLERYSENGKLWQRWWMNEGQVYRMDEDSFFQSRLTTSYLYKAGKLWRVYRDLDGDEVPEIMEQHGELGRYLVLGDLDGNKKPEYYWFVGPPSLEIWDFKESGRASMRLFHGLEGQPVEVVTLGTDEPFSGMTNWEVLPWP